MASKISNAIEAERGAHGIEIEEFFKYLEAYRQKSVGLYKNIWHRGCITIVKKFKFLKPKNVDNGLWTFGGYNPSNNETAVLGLTSEEKRLRM